MDSALLERTRAQIVEAIVHFLAGQDLLTLADIRNELIREIDNAGPDALIALKDRLTRETGWEYYPRDPLAERIHHVLADRFLEADSELAGAEHLASVMNAPIAIFANHLSYADANAVQVLLQRGGGRPIADRLTAIAGPKVFSDRHRRFSSLCFGTVKVPQSSDVSSEDAVLGAREVARAARRAIDVAHERLRAGDALLVFAEGTRSRTASMQRMLPAVARYLDVPGTRVLPAGLTGSEAFFPVGDSTIRPARIMLRVGAPISAEALIERANGDRKTVMDAIGLAVAELLPPSYRGVYGNDDDVADAMRVLRDARTSHASRMPENARE